MWCMSSWNVWRYFTCSRNRFLILKCILQLMVTSTSTSTEGMRHGVNVLRSSFDYMLWLIIMLHENNVCIAMINCLKGSIKFHCVISHKRQNNTFVGAWIVSQPHQGLAFIFHVFQIDPASPHILSSWERATSRIHKPQLCFWLIWKFWIRVNIFP